LSDDQGVLFSHIFVSVLLPLTGELAIGELVEVEVLMSATVWSIEDGERKER